jgi:transposase-like protein
MKQYKDQLADYKKRRDAILAMAEKKGVRVAAQKYGISSQRVYQLMKRLPDAS